MPSNERKLPPRYCRCPNTNNYEFIGGGQWQCHGCEMIYNDMPSEAVETVNHPNHYNTGRFEVIDVIEDWQLGFHLGNALKYVARAGKKDPSKEEEDLRKAIWYIERKLQCLRNSKAEK